MKRYLLTTLFACLLTFGLPLLLHLGPGPEASKEAEASDTQPSPLTSASPQNLNTGEVLDSDMPLTLWIDGAVRETDMAAVLPYFLAGEMPAAFETEALKAQAVALRSYILRCAGEDKPNHPDAQICASPDCCAHMATDEQLRESWGENYDSYLRRVRQAVSDTDGQYLAYQGEAILAVFHSSSQGRTEDGANIWSPQPYLVSVDSPETEGRVTNLHTSVEISTEEFRRGVLSAAPDARLGDDPASWLGDVELNSSGRVGSISIGGADISGLTLRQLFSLRSTNFTVEYSDGVFVFQVYGYGHGVGMSQYGANILAQQGAMYADILEHYYPGVELVVAVVA